MMIKRILKRVIENIINYIREFLYHFPGIAILSLASIGTVVLLPTKTIIGILGYNIFDKALIVPIMSVSIVGLLAIMSGVFADAYENSTEFMFI